VLVSAAEAHTARGIRQTTVYARIYIYTHKRYALHIGDSNDYTPSGVIVYLLEMGTRNESNLHN